MSEYTLWMDPRAKLSMFGNFIRVGWPITTFQSDGRRRHGFLGASADVRLGSRFSWPRPAAFTSTVSRSCLSSHIINLRAESILRVQAWRTVLRAAKRRLVMANTAR